MDIQFNGANCITLSTKQARVVIDDNLADLGGKSVAKAGDIVLYTAAHGDPAQSPKIAIDQPGEYEVSGISIYGIAARAHMDEEGSRTAVIYKLITEDLRILIVGHIYPELSDKQLESIGMVDAMFVPVGGNGYTLDAVGALKLIKKIEPKIVIPTHYDNASLSYPVSQRSLAEAVKELAMEPAQTVSGKFKLKHTDLNEATQLIIFES